MAEKKPKQFNPESPLFKNLASDLSDEKLNQIGEMVVQGYEDDDLSRESWKKQYNIYTRLFYVRPEFDSKNDPWEGAANVVLPVITIACTQFWARALDALFSSKQVVKTFPVENSPGSMESAERVEKHMNIQVQYRMENFYEGMSKSLMQLPLSGTVIRKTYFDDSKNECVSDFVSPDKFVINYYTKYLESSPRYSHLLTPTYADMKIKEQSGIYINVSKIPEMEAVEETDMKKSQNQNIGQAPPTEDIFAHREVIEQHVLYGIFDKNGKEAKDITDAIVKPYVITVDKETRTTLRIVDREIDYKKKTIRFDYFTKYEFLPSPDDGFYGIGFGILLYRMTEIMNTLINELTDAGSLANTQGGFINKKSGLKRGSLKFKRGEFVESDFNTDDIRKSLYPIDFKEPSFTLFNLLNMLQDYSNRVTTVSEMFTGELPRSDTSATAVISLLEQGLKVFSAIYKGLHKSFNKELQKIYKLNGVYLKGKRNFPLVVNDDDIKTKGVTAKIQSFEIAETDYEKEIEIIPVSDPQVISKTEKVAKAQMIYQTILTNPVTGQNPLTIFEALMNFLKQVEDNEAVLVRIMAPVATQLALKKQAEEQQAMIQQQTDQAIAMFEDQLMRGTIPPELLNIGLQTMAQIRATQGQEVPSK